MKKSKVNTPVITGDKDTDALLDMEQINQELPKNQVALHSVGSVLDTEVAVLYPMNVDGSADYDGAFCLEDVDKEWFEELSEADHLIAYKTMISYSNFPLAAKDIVILKRMLEESYSIIRMMQGALDNGEYKHFVDASESLLQRLDKVIKV